MLRPLRPSCLDRRPPDTSGRAAPVYAHIACSKPFFAPYIPHVKKSNVKRLR